MKTDRLRPTRNVVDARRGRQPRALEMRYDRQVDEGRGNRPTGVSGRDPTIERRTNNAILRNDINAGRANNRHMYGRQGVERESGVSPVVRELNERDTTPNPSPDPNTPNSRVQRFEEFNRRSGPPRS